MLFAVTLHNIPEGNERWRRICGGCLTGIRHFDSGSFALAIGMPFRTFRGSHYFSAVMRRRNEPEKSVYLRDAFRYCGTDRGIYYNFDRRADHSDFAIFIIVCGRGDDICRDRRVDTGIAGGGT